MRSGMVLFVSMTAVATAILSLIFFGNAWREGWTPASAHVLWFAQSISVVTVPTCLVLVLAAWRGRRQPVLDGILLITVVGLLICSAIYVAFLNSEPLARSYASLAWLYYVAGLVTIIPAYLITYFALRRTPLLRGLAPPHKSKGPAEASP